VRYPHWVVHTRGGLGGRGNQRAGRSQIVVGTGLAQKRSRLSFLREMGGKERGYRRFCFVGGVDR